MNSKTQFKLASFVDRHIGIPLCILFGLLLKLFLHRGKRKEEREFPRRVLVLKWFGMGSIILMEPLLRVIHRQFPEAKIIFLTFSKNKALLKLMRQCDEIRCIDMGNPFIFAAHVIKQIYFLKKSRINVVIDLEFYSAFSTLMAFLSGAPKRIGFYLPDFWRRSLFTHPIFFNCFKHITEIYRSAGRQMSVDYDDLKPSRIRISAQQENEVRNFLKQRGWDGEEKLVGININAGELAYSRRWPQEYFIKLAEAVAATGHVRIILVGAREDRGYVDDFYKKLNPSLQDRVINVAGQMDLEQFVALVSMMGLFITNDSGPLHLAYVQDVPTVSFWGPGHPSLYGAKAEQRHKAFYLKLDCSPCLYFHKSNPGYFCDNKAPCLQLLKPAEVISYVLDFLSK